MEKKRISPYWRFGDKVVDIRELVEAIGIGNEIDAYILMELLTEKFDLGEDEIGSVSDLLLFGIGFFGLIETHMGVSTIERIISPEELIKVKWNKGGVHYPETIIVPRNQAVEMVQSGNWDEVEEYETELSNLQ